jgi:hypothetical protein
MCQVKLCRGQNINTSRGFSALASTDGAFGNTGRALDSLISEGVLCGRRVFSDA